MLEPGEIQFGPVYLPRAVQATICYDADGDGVDRAMALGFANRDGDTLHFQLSRYQAVRLMTQMVDVFETIWLDPEESP